MNKSLSSKFVSAMANKEVLYQYNVNSSGEATSTTPLWRVSDVLEVLASIERNADRRYDELQRMRYTEYELVEEY